MYKFREYDNLICFHFVWGMWKLTYLSLSIFLNNPIGLPFWTLFLIIIQINSWEEYARYAHSYASEIWTAPKKSIILWNFKLHGGNTWMLAFLSEEWYVFVSTAFTRGGILFLAHNVRMLWKLTLNKLIANWVKWKNNQSDVWHIKYIWLSKDN